MLKLALRTLNPGGEHWRKVYCGQDTIGDGSEKGLRSGTNKMAVFGHVLPDKSDEGNGFRRGLPGGTEKTAVLAARAQAERSGWASLDGGSRQNQKERDLDGGSRSTNVKQKILSAQN